MENNSNDLPRVRFLDSICLVGFSSIWLESPTIWWGYRLTSYYLLASLVDSRFEGSRRFPQIHPNIRSGSQNFTPTEIQPVLSLAAMFKSEVQVQWKANRNLNSNPRTKTKKSTTTGCVYFPPPHSGIENSNIYEYLQFFQ